MSFLHGWAERAKHLFQRREIERDLEEELAFHMEQAELLEESAGVPREEAKRRARLRFGSEDRFREEVRDTWTGTLLLSAAQDARRGVRRLFQHPGFTAVALCSLALGIGANTAMFSVVRSVLLEPFPYRAPAELVLIWDESGSQADESWMSARELVEYRAATRSFSGLAAYTGLDASLTEGADPERVRAAAVTGNLFGTLGVPALRGRTLTEGDETTEADAVVVIGHDLWQRRFGGADIIGDAIRVNGIPRRVIGVMPPDFQLPLDYRNERPTELWVPAAIDPTDDLPWGSRSYYLVGRLASGVTPAHATTDLQRVLRVWEGEGFVSNAGGGLDRAAIPLDALLLGGVRPALLILFGAVILVLIIACGNVMHLLLARSEGRRREVATQVALGASRRRIARQLVVEHGVLAVTGALLGLFLAWIAVRVAPATVPVNIIRSRDVTLDTAVLAFTGLLALVATMVAGVAPALRLARVDVADAMRSSRGDVAPLRGKVRTALVVVETGLAVILVVGATLLARSFNEMRQIDLGFETARVLTLRVELPATDYADGDRVAQFYSSLLDRVRQLPGVESAGAVRVLPLTQTIGDWSITIEGSEYTPEDNPNADWQVATAGYLETMRIPLVAGRYPSAADGPDSAPVAVINEAMASRYWPGENALGRRFHMGTLDQPWIEVVGVIPNVRHNAAIEDAREEMVLLHSQFPAVTGGSAPRRGMTLAVRTSADPLALAPTLRDAVRQMDPRLPVTDIRTLDEVAGAALAQPRFTAVLITTFATLALILAAIGLYGIIAFMAARRTKEMGVRLALGAQRSDIIRLVMGEGMALAGAGVLLGTAAAAAMTRLLEGQLFGVAPLDPATFLGVAALLLLIAALAAYLPARRAASTSVVAALTLD